MLKIRNGRLRRDVSATLAEYQDDIDRQPNYPLRVERAKRQFATRNRNTNATFNAVKAKLTGMCNDARRCMYCEDSVADEVEHFQPKDLYPELVFAWRNFLYACAPCNGPKNNRFGVMSGLNDQVINVTRPRGAPIAPPQPGLVALINPLRENPLDFMMLDLQGTFEFTPLAAPGTGDRLRTEYTLEILRLNERDYLIEARENAFGGFRARLSEYVQRRRDGASVRELARLRRGIQRAPHPTIWAEMKRQHAYHPALAQLFRGAPEARRF